MLTFEDQATVDFVGEHHDVAVSDHSSDVTYICFLEHAASRILWRVEDDEFCTRRDLLRKFIHVKAEEALFA